MMEIKLTEVEARIVGALVEKQLTTPEYYPLTLNSLKAACNQKSNRHPVMTLDDKTLLRTLDSLRQKHLVFEKSVPGGRVYKYEHRLTDCLPFSQKEIATLAVLLLRGPQTVGEIKSRAHRLYDFAEISEVEDVLAELMAHESGCFVKELPLQSGRREHRYAQLLTGEIDLPEEDFTPPPQPARIAIDTENSRLDQLEKSVADLTEELARLRDAFEAFKKEFE